MGRPAALLITAIVGATALAGCGSEPADTRDRGAAAFGGHFSVEGSLHALPELKRQDDRPLQVFAGDLHEAAELGDLPKPVDQQSLADWSKGLATPPLFVASSEGLGLQYLQSGAMRRTVGFDARDVTTFAAVEALPEDITVVNLAKGAGLTKGVDATGKGTVGDMDPTWPDTAPFPFVHGVAQRDDKVALSRSSAVLATWTKGTGRSLADNDALLAVAKALDAHGSYSAFLSDGPGKLPNLPPAALKAMKSTMPAFDAVGIAQGVEDGKAVEYIAYHADDAEKAKDRIEKTWTDGTSARTREPLAKLLDVDDVTVKDGVVTVKISPKGSAGLAVQMFMQGDVPFIVVD